MQQIASSSGHCCTQQSAKITYRFKRNCIIYSLMRTCGVELSSEIQTLFDTAFPDVAKPVIPETGITEALQAELAAYDDQLYSVSSQQVAELKITFYKQCQQCREATTGIGCQAIGFCDSVSPIVNEESSISVCTKKCKPHMVENRCIPKHILSELEGFDLGLITDKDLNVVHLDEDYQDLRMRCFNE